MMNIINSLVVAILVCVAFPAAAQTAPDTRLRDQLRETTTKLRALEDENSSLKARVDTLTQQLGPAAATPGATAAPKIDDAEVKALRAKAQRENARAEELQQKMGTVEPILARWKQAYEEVATLAKTRDADAKRFEADYNQTHAAERACVADNASLVKISQELLAQYREKGVWSAMRASEPVLGISKIKFEKLAQDYHGRIVDATAAPVTELKAP